MKSFFIAPFMVFLMIFSCFKIQAQTEKKPKIAVVLSGGGAKGIAHISLLQTLDSLGIVPDLIVGASMGSLVGGFYAMGYSGDSIAEITLNVDWDKLLGGKTLLKDVGVEEKSEFDRYLLPLGVENRKLKSSSAIINDQYLREFFAKLTYPAYTINKFDDLPIPYRAVTTDILNG
ncbi:MAG: patatin-like phospholipase family protein, partial [Saprospiraceae bacterium]|nr:patatin-like phospholipase family protein [Saprospiraceae bacterium]